jgi:hypothetical protein
VYRSPNAVAPRPQRGQSVDTQVGTPVAGQRNSFVACPDEYGLAYLSRLEQLQDEHADVRANRLIEGMRATDTTLGPRALDSAP